MRQKIADAHSAPYGEVANQLSAEGIIALKEELQAAKALIAMQDEALGAIAEPIKHLGVWAKYAPRMSDDAIDKDIAQKAISATSEDVEAWLRERDAEVLSRLLSRYPFFHSDEGNWLRVSIEQDIAELRKNGGK